MQHILQPLWLEGNQIFTKQIRSTCFYEATQAKCIWQRPLPFGSEQTGVISDPTEGMRSETRVAVCRNFHTHQKHRSFVISHVELQMATPLFLLDSLVLNCSCVLTIIQLNIFGACSFFPPLCQTFLQTHYISHGPKILNILSFRTHAISLSIACHCDNLFFQNKVLPSVGGGVVDTYSKSLDKNTHNLSQ